MAGFIKSLLMPSNFIIFCVLLGLILLCFKQLRRPAIGLLAGAGILLTLFSTGTVACLLLSPLEYEFPFVKNPEDYPEVRHIVVLTGYAADDPLIPLSSRVNSSSAYRLLETQRLYRACTKCDIFITGYDTATEIMKKLLVSMSVPEDKIQLESHSPHTYVSAQNLKPVIGSESFYLVTSAGHMPRAVGVFQKQGLKPIPAPTDYQLPKDFLNASISPSPQHLYWSDLAIREYGGLIWYKLTGKL